MTFFEWYNKVMIFFEERHVPVFVHGSTLLGIARENSLWERMPFDKEINIGIRSGDLTLQLLLEMKQEFPYFFATGDKLENSLIYFGPEPIINYLSKNQNHWDMQPGFALLAVFWEGKTKWIEYMGNNACLTWPKYQLEEFSTAKLANRSVNVPFNMGAWLEHYFGEDFMIPNLSWHWSTDSHNLEKFDKLVADKEI